MIMFIAGFATCAVLATALWFLAKWFLAGFEG